MSGRQSGVVRSSAIRLGTAIALVVGAANTALAQQPLPPGSSGAMQDPAFERIREEQAREAQLRSMEMRPLNTKDHRRVEAVVQQVKQDFTRIQVVRNEMVHALLSGQPLDFRFFADKTGEVNKRASRLMVSLAPRRTEAGEKEQKDPVELKDDQVKGSLVRLCNLIIGFVENPALKAPEVLDVEQSAKAGRDLQSIIELSGSIRKSAERLQKTSK